MVKLNSLKMSSGFVDHFSFFSMSLSGNPVGYMTVCNDSLNILLHNRHHYLNSRSGNCMKLSAGTANFTAD